MLRALPLCTCCRYYPGAATGVTLAHSPSRISLPRNGGRVGLRNDLFEACSAFTHVTACTTHAATIFAARFTGGFNRFVTSTVAPVASGWSSLAGWDFHPLGKRRLTTAHARSRHCLLGIGGVISLGYLAIDSAYVAIDTFYRHDLPRISCLHSNTYLRSSRLFSDLV